MIEKVRQCVSHTHPTDDWSAFCRSSSEPETIENLETTAINAVRALAAQAIASAIWHDKRWFEVFRPDIERLIQDPHPGVRIAALEACAAAWNVGQPGVLEWFFTAIESDPRVAACHRARNFYNHLFPEHAERFVPIIRLMLVSDQDDVAEVGATEVAGRWILYGLFESEMRTIKSGSLPQRKGFAQVAGDLL